MTIRGKSHLEEGFANLWRLLAGEPEPQREFKFHAKRNWRFDFAWPEYLVAVEMEGGIFMPKGGHRSIGKYMVDSEKYNEAAVLGWRVIRFNAKDIKDRPAQCIDVVQRAIELNRGA